MQSESTRPSIFMALVLSLLCPGFGHLYVGRWRRGLTLFLCLLLFAPAMVLLTMSGPTTPLLVLMLGLVAGELLLQLYAVVDGVRVAVVDRNACGKPMSGRLLGLLVAIGLCYPLGSVWVLRSNVVQGYEIAAASMSPNLNAQDVVLVNRLQHNMGRDLQRGDLVVFRAPGQRDQAYAKRVVGLPGDTVEWVKGDLWVNGNPLIREPVPAPSSSPVDDAANLEAFAEENAGRRYTVWRSTLAAASAEPVTVPTDTCYVAGDHRSNSKDSRAFGCVPVGDVLGLVDYVVKPAEGWRRFGACR